MSIISISGYIGSGKDEVGNIIQYLTHCKDDDTTYEEWQTSIHFSFCEWEIKKFAYKLKKVSAIILGCDVKDFEDRDFKNKELGPEWDRYLLPAGIPKYFISLEEAKAYVDKDYHHKIVKIAMTPRLFLQIAGTDAMRDIVHKNIWVNALFADYKAIESKWIITDTRFPNELSEAKRRGGFSIWITRPREEKEGLFLHSSETSLDDAKFDYYLDNTGSIEELIEKVRLILRERKII